MSGIRLATIRGIPVSLHWTLLPIVALLIAQWGLLGLPAGVILFGSILLHELGHSVVAQRFGVRIRGIHLHLLGGAAMMEDHPSTPRQELLIAAAGPAVSFALGFTALGLSWVLGAGLDPFSASAGAALLAYTAWLNLAMGVFNLIPALPMDGGRILRAALTPRFGEVRATQMSARLARLFALVFVVLGFAQGSWTLPFIGLFVWFLAGREERMAEIREIRRRAAAQPIAWTPFRIVLASPSRGGGPVIDVTPEPWER